jgi:hypothetical protein
VLWTIWTENPEAWEAGGIDLVPDQRSAEADRAMHTARLAGFGIPRLDIRRYEVNRER